MFGRKQKPDPVPTFYTYIVYPENIDDGHHEFNGIEVFFEKPGWQWVIREHRAGKWPRVHSAGEGFPTRDAALVDLLEHARLLKGEIQLVRVL
jgi:hypothetical protein